MRRDWKAALVKLWREWCAPILVVLIVFGSFRSAVADWNDVPTGSMKPTILEGDRIFVNKMAYGLRVPFTSWRLAEWEGPLPGDIVILFSPETGDRLVKRVVGVPGDTVAMRDNRVYINGRAVTYDPADDDMVEPIKADVRSRYQFSAETLGDRRHAIMTTPARPSRRSFAPVKLDEDSYFVMGDNRDNSKDSRWFGTVDRRRIVGRVVRVVLSVDRDRHYMPRWNRFFRGLP